MHWASQSIFLPLFQLKESSNLNLPRTFLVSGKQRSLELQARYPPIPCLRPCATGYLPGGGGEMSPKDAPSSGGAA